MEGRSLINCFVDLLQVNLQFNDWNRRCVNELEAMQTTLHNYLKIVAQSSHLIDLQVSVSLEI